MKAVIACATAFAASCAQANELPETLALESAYSILHVMDWNQTRRIARNPLGFYEKNLLLGAHPSPLRVNRYFAATLAAHWGLALALPTGYRRVFQGVSIAVEANTVRKNYAIGLSARF